jgi:hypothetical protein
MFYEQIKKRRGSGNPRFPDINLIDEWANLYQGKSDFKNRKGVGKKWVIPFLTNLIRKDDVIRVNAHVEQPIMDTNTNANAEEPIADLTPLLLTILQLSLAVAVIVY